MNQNEIQMIERLWSALKKCLWHFNSITGYEANLEMYREHSQKMAVNMKTDTLWHVME